MRIRDLSINFRKQSSSSEINQQKIETQQQPQANSDVTRAQQAATKSDAVVLHSSFRKGNAESGGDSDRQNKVEAIKQKVRDGSYEPEKEGVAVAVIRDLGL